MAYNVSLDEENSGIYTSEEILAMILKHVKDLSEAQSKSEIHDIVLTIPQDWNMNQRKMLIDAAELSGLRVVSLITENVGAAIAYGVDRIDESDHIVLFINLGASDLELTLMRFFTTEKSGKKVENIEVLLEDGESNVGGFMFDKALVEIMVDHFNTNPKRKGKEDIRSNPRIMKRLFKEVSKYKEILSANNNVIVKLPELDGEINLDMTITREQFENAIKPYAEKIDAAIKRIIKTSGLSVNSIHSFEIIGGGLRVPIIKDTISNAIGDNSI